MIEIKKLSFLYDISNFFMYAYKSINSGFQDAIDWFFIITFVYPTQICYIFFVDITEFLLPWQPIFIKINAVIVGLINLFLLFLIILFCRWISIDTTDVEIDKIPTIEMSIMTYKAFKRGHKIFKKYGLNIAWLNFNKLDERVFILFFCEYINHTIWYLENTKNIDESLDKIIKVVKALLKMHDMLLIERRLNIIEIELVLNELKELDSRTKNFFEYVLERIKLTIFYLKVDAESIINDLGRGNSLINTRILFVLFFKEHIQIQNTEIGNVDYNRQGIINILQNYVCMNNDSKENYVYMNNDSKENYAYINDYSKISPFEFDLQKLEPSAKKKCILSILYYYIDVTQIDLNNNIEVKVNIQKMADIFTIIKFLKKIDISENLNLIRVLNMIVKLNLPGYLNIARIIQFPDKTKNEPIEYYYMTYKFMEEITFKYGYPHKIIKIRELNNNEQAMFYIEYLIIMIKVLKTLNNLPKYKKFKKEINNEIMRYKYLLSIELKNFK